jgi:putative membrane protein
LRRWFQQVTGATPGARELGSKFLFIIAELWDFFMPTTPSPSAAATSGAAPQTASRGRRAIQALIDIIRGSLIGFVEIVPGVSGGTIALIVGVYDALIDGAGHLARGTALLVADGVRGRGIARSAAHFASIRWGVLIPIGIGMLSAIVVGAALLAPLLESHPTETRAVFIGLIAASLIVPIRMVGGAWSVRETIVGLIAAAATFLLTGLPQAAATDPSLVVVAFAGAFAVCALVLPGVSGSYLLLTVGMYAPTLAAVNDRNFAYLAVFAVGALVGLGAFVSVLQWLLSAHRRMTLVVMTGLMLGSLRALWPWQSESGGVLAPTADWWVAVLLAVLGAAVVITIIIVETALVSRTLLSPEMTADPEPDSRAHTPADAATDSDSKPNVQAP